jgi:putative SOS response-associated peptidase YedK
MCGRFTLRTPAKEIAEQFGVDVPDLQLRFNIAPSQEIATVRINRDTQKRELAMLRWGLIPFWAKDPKIGYSTINARAETVATKPAFREAFRKRRCLIVADGFYEWRKTNGKKQPYLIHLKDDRPFAFAGLWERWKRDETEIQSASIIVTDPNELVDRIHDRMPVILNPDDYGVWLDREFEDGKRLLNMLRPFPADRMDAYPVSTVVNNPRNDAEECVQRVAIE